MKVTNLTEEVQKLSVRSLIGDRESFDIFVQPKGTTDLPQKLIFDASKYKGIFKFEGDAIPVAKKSSSTEKKEEDAVEEKVEEKKEEAPVKEVKEEAPAEEAPKSAYVCDICGAEFGSAKGLKAHKNKAHAE